ncbi:MAG TPA: hypothetical protein VM492_11800, partial [Sumerlaeia bacterium]|nr:hypothetical protein [Sumerlaeia bacterium]
GVEGPLHFLLTAVSDVPASAADLTITPLGVLGAAETRRSAAVFVSVDRELTEQDLSKASPRPPSEADRRIAERIVPQSELQAGDLRAYALDSAAPLRLRLKTIEATSFDTVFNQVTIREGFQSLDCVLRAEPRRGRLRKIEALLLARGADPGVASRLETSGPVRDVETESVSESLLRVTVQLSAPQDRPVEVRFRLDQPYTFRSGNTVPLAVFHPADRGGARAFLLLRRAFEGELAEADAAGARSVDPGSVPWPTDRIRPLPSDRAFELSLAASGGPSFTVRRHAREEALRAVVELLRQTTIVTEDGLERHELEIKLQNQSEQFLKIALPHPKEQVAIYQTQTAGRVVEASFGVEQGREVLLVPLIRTGLLDPEVEVRVAYTVQGRPPLEGGGRRGQVLPEILGGIPVAESRLVLMLPQNFEYGRFQGSLDPVDPSYLETRDALRGAEKAKQLSERALHAGREVQEAAVSKLGLYNFLVQSRIESAQKIAAAQEREARGVAKKDTELGRRRYLLRDEKAKEAGYNIERAQAAAQAGISNVFLIQERIAEERPTAETPAVAKEEAPATPPISFPRAGDAFTFWQLQGTGNVTFKYASRESASHRNDVLFALALTLGAAVLTWVGRHLLASGRRAALAVLAASALSAVSGVALDVAVPAGIAALVFLMLKRRKTGAQR